MPPHHLAVIRHDRVATFLLKKTPFTPEETRPPRGRRRTSSGSRVLYAPGAQPPPEAADPVEMQRTRHERRRLPAADSCRRIARRFSTAIRSTSRRRPTIVRSSFTRRGSATSSNVAFGRVDALRQRPERAADAHGDFARARRCSSSWARCWRAADGPGPAGAGGCSTSGRSAPGSCCSRSRCCSGSCCCSDIRCIRSP